MIELAESKVQNSTVAKDLLTSDLRENSPIHPYLPIYILTSTSLMCCTCSCQAVTQAV